MSAIFSLSSGRLVQSLCYLPAQTASVVLRAAVAGHRPTAAAAFCTLTRRPEQPQQALQAQQTEGHTAIWSRGLKHVDNPQLRCSHCYYEVVDERLYVKCTARPRHKQVSSELKLKHRMIMTHATQGASCHGNGKGRKEMWTQQSFRCDF